METMEIIFHIGMGKTGTSSIQEALALNVEKLRAQNVEYLGMWFSVISEAMVGYLGQQNFYSSTPTQMADHAQVLLSRLESVRQDTGVSRFVLSNESIFGHVKKMTPFFVALRAQADLRLVAYVRDPRDWLPSAYQQWVIYHKATSGPILPFRQRARDQIGQYNGVLQWNESFSDILTVREFRKSVDVVEDFADTIGVELDIPAKRVQERADTSEALLRAFYNARHDTAQLPQEFDQAVKHFDIGATPTIDGLVRDSFTYDGIDTIISERIAIFDSIKSSLGIDLLGEHAPMPKAVDADALRKRLLEHLLTLTMQQAEQIRVLEGQVAQLIKTLR